MGKHKPIHATGVTILPSFVVRFCVPQPLPALIVALFVAFGTEKHQASKWWPPTVVIKICWIFQSSRPPKLTASAPLWPPPVLRGMGCIQEAVSGVPPQQPCAGWARRPKAKASWRTLPGSPRLVMKGNEGEENDNLHVLPHCLRCKKYGEPSPQKWQQLAQERSV